MLSHNYSILETLRRGPLQVSIIGSGNWGTVIGKIAALNAKESYIFENVVRIWVHEEIVEGRKLSEWINVEHENSKYLPGYRLPDNLVAVPDLEDIATSTDLFIFVVPHQFVEKVCEILSSYAIRRTAKAVSLIKGFLIDNWKPLPFHQYIQNVLKIECSAISGANVAKDIADEQFSETTLGYSDQESAVVWQQLLDTKYFKVNPIPDKCGVQICGAVKNVIALAAGFCDALNCGSNTKATIIRIGFEEMKNFANLFFDGILEETFFDSAGLADTITTCYGGRNVKCAKEFALAEGNKTWEEIEVEMLNGQKLQGPSTCCDLFSVITHHKLEQSFPLFTIIYCISYQHVPPHAMLTLFQRSETRPIRLKKDCHLCISSNP
uniref:Glycerol-3-phosphate dehydrogenase [NAD(+)] n=1 Tax=Nephromyces sp. MMRI TaxID=2496275 RepID=A0A3S8V2W7_9APIC|nr:glucose-6-phosphate 1-dehydrogenase [Nephromyces sp. MMRI]